MRRWMLSILIGACSSSTSTRPTDDLAFGSVGDVRDVLAANGVNHLTLACKNPSYGPGEEVRAVACQITLTAAQVATLRKSVPLAPSVGFLEDLHDACKGGETLLGENQKVTNGVGRIELHLLDRATGKACIQIEYPWSS